MTTHRRIHFHPWPLLLALVLSAPPPARAAPKADPVMTAARARADHAAKLLKSGDVAGALEDYESARRLKPASAFDLGVAHCYERLGRMEDARAMYRKVLDSLDSLPADATEARERLKALQGKVDSVPAPAAATAKGTAKPGSKAAAGAAKEPAARPGAVAAKEPAARPGAAAKREPAPPAAAVPPPEEVDGDDEASEPEPEPEPPRKPATGPFAWFLEPRHLFYTGIGGAVAAVVLVGGGLALFMSSDADYNQFHATCSPGCNPGDVDASRAKEIVGDVLMTLGFVVAAADVALWIYRDLFHRERPARERGERTAWILPSGTGLVAGGRF
jgi:hypothetical protein